MDDPYLARPLAPGDGGRTWVYDDAGRLTGCVLDDGRTLPVEPPDPGHGGDDVQP